jgi:hypothetical protein
MIFGPVLCLIIPSPPLLQQTTTAIAAASTSVATTRRYQASATYKLGDNSSPSFHVKVTVSQSVSQPVYMR